MEVRNKKSNRNLVSSIPVTFEGGLQSCVRAELIKELLKYFLYERQQIPLPFDHIKREVKQVLIQQQMSHKQKGHTIHNRLEQKKAIDAVKKLEETFGKVDHAFEICPEIKQAAIVLGATPVSPKEMYVIEMPPLNPDADNLSSKVCVKSLFRQLIMQDPLNCMKEIRPTNISLLLHAPRDSELSWFYPKPLYKLPVRGKRVHFSLQSTCGQGNHDISKDFSVIDLSGFEPLDSFIEDVSMSSDTTHMESMSASSEGSVSADYVCIESDNDLDIIDTSQNSQDVTPTNASDCDVNCSQSSGAGRYMSKSNSTSSILSQSSVISDKSIKRASNIDCSSSDKMVVSDDKDDGIFSLTEREYIWFQSPLLVKGYRNKATRKC